MNVSIYTTDHCPYCHLAMEFFKQNNIPFEEINVSHDRAKAEEMIAKSGQMGTPVIDVDGNIIVGFDKNALKRALKV